MASYLARAVAIHQFVSTLRRTLEQHVGASATDQAELISLAVESTNKLLYCFLISQEMFDKIDALLNDHLDVQAEPHAISILYLRTLAVVRQLEKHAAVWVMKYN
jgi:hypothetical protein